MSSRVAEILLKTKLVDELQVRSALAKQGQWGGRLGRHIVEMGFAPETAIVDALAKACGLQRVELGAMPRDAVALTKIDARIAEEQAVFPYALRDNGKTLWVAMADPCDIGVVDSIAARCGCRVRTSVAGEREILTAIYRHYKNQAPPASLMGGNSRAPAPAPDEGPMDIVDMQGLDLDVPASRPTPAAFAAPVRGAVRAPTPRPFPAAPPRAPNPWADAPSQAFAEPAAAYPPPAAAPASAPPPRTPTPAHGMRVELPAAVAEYLRSLHADLEKTSKVLRGLIELCVERQVFSGDEIKAVIARLVSR
jgi:hypothetical protein